MGDCLEKLKDLPDESVDLVLTDPPYGLEFMGKKWDSWGDSFNERWASAVFPKMKAGSFLVFTMSPRQDLLWRCLAGLEKADFELKTSGMFWLYHTGFPKAMDVSKGIDKRKGLKGKIVGENPNYREIGKEGYMGETTFAVTDNMKFKTEPKSVEAKRWAGWKSFSLKPAVECIVVAQKPRKEKTIVGQVLATGTGAVNVGGCRIPYASEKLDFGKQGNRKAAPENVLGLGFKEHDNISFNEYSVAGRFPANLLVEGEPLEGEDSKGGKFVVGGTPRKGWDYSATPDRSNAIMNIGDLGSPNRFYSLDAWARKRGITLAEGSAFFDVPKPSKAEKNEGLDGFEEKHPPTTGKDVGGKPHDKDNPRLKRNVHPTCKPVNLFCYLAEMFCQPNGLVLDPFMGSGTTGIAALKMGKRFVGIEKEEEYFKIAEARIKPFKEQTKLEAKK